MYEYKLVEFKDRFKEEELLKIVGNPQNKIMMVNKFVISKLIKPLIQDNEEYYEVQWKGYRETTLEPRDILLKMFLRWLINLRRRRILSSMIVRTRKQVR